MLTTLILGDVFVNTSAVYPFRGFACTATNTWTSIGARNPYYQTVSDDDNVTYNNLAAKVTYANNRWGATIYYVDSTVYSKKARRLISIFFRQLQQAFPTCLFFPENESTLFYGASAPYNQTGPPDFASDTAQYIKDIYPQAFSMLQAIDNVNYADPVTYNKMVQSVRNGNILFVDGWWSNPQNANILKSIA